MLISCQYQPLRLKSEGVVVPSSFTFSDIQEVKGRVAETANAVIRQSNFIVELSRGITVGESCGGRHNGRERLVIK